MAIRALATIDKLNLDYRKDDREAQQIANGILPGNGTQISIIVEGKPLVEPKLEVPEAQPAGAKPKPEAKPEGKQSAK